MAVMGIADMRMGMLNLLMTMLVGMPEGPIGGEAFQILRCVIVLVMGNSMALLSTRIMPVAMGMQQGFMAMPVAVLLQQQEHHPSTHQPSRQ